MGFLLKLIIMQNSYEIQNYYFLVFSLARTCTTFSPLPQVVVYCVRQRTASKLGSGNCVRPKSQPLKLNIFVDGARRTVNYTNYKTAISVEITCWEDEQFPLTSGSSRYFLHPCVRYPIRFGGGAALRSGAQKT